MKTIICYRTVGADRCSRRMGRPPDFFPSPGLPIGPRCWLCFARNRLLYRLHYSFSLGIVSIGVADTRSFRIH